jgi:hypothetical protein
MLQAKFMNWIQLSECSIQFVSGFTYWVCRFLHTWDFIKRT